MIQKATTLHRLRIFKLVYELGSFNKAARQMYLSQAAVSQHIQALETALGTRLFQRTPSGTKPTAAADVYFGYAEKILALVSEAENAVMTIDEASAGTLNIGATSGISVYLLPGWLKRFQDDYANVSLSLQTERTAEILQRLLNRQLDFIFFVGEIGSLQPRDLSQHWLDEIEYAVVMPAEHPLAQEAVITHDQLRTVNFLARKSTSRHQRWLDKAMARLGITLQNTAELDNPGVIKYALLEQLGVSILPMYSVQREVQRGEIVAKPLESGPLTRPLKLGWEKKRPFDPIQRAFLVSLLDQFPRLKPIINVI